MDNKVLIGRHYSDMSQLPMYETKHDSKQDPYSPSPSSRWRGRPRRSVFIYPTVILFTFLIISCSSPGLFSNPYRQPNLRAKKQQSRLGPSDQQPFVVAQNTSRVPLEAHIMSKCPDAKTCLRDLVVPAMEKIADKVDFRLSYIGKVDDSDTVHCMHGSTECLGNMMGLCANDLYPNNTKISLGFTTCLIMHYEQIPSRDLAESCALEHGIPFRDLNACISEEGRGLDLLTSSVERSEKAGVKKSCTVRVGGEKWCIMDGGQWKECGGGHEVKDLVAEIERRSVADKT